MQAEGVKTIMLTRAPAAIFASIFLAFPALSQNATLSYQGHLANAAGRAITASYPMTFALYASPDGDAVLWEETIDDVDVIDGTFNVDLGATVPSRMALAQRVNLSWRTSQRGSGDETSNKVSTILRAQWAKTAVCSRCTKAKTFIQPA